jgi:tripartite-type tricarboxylate transporter receptor subunit TctC
MDDMKQQFAETKGLACSRRSALATLAASAWGATAPTAWAQGAWPARPIKIIVPFPPGVGVDVAVRIIIPKLGERLGQSFLVENKPGAGANIGIEQAARSGGDGYTLLGTASNFTANPSLYSKVNYDPLRDFVPVAGLIRTPSVLVVAADSPVRSVDGLVAQIRAKPGGLNYASGGSGSLAHFAGELFRSAMGVEAVHVPYKGAPDIINSLVGRQTEYAFPVLVSALPHIKSGRLRALAVTARQRSTHLPDVPTMHEATPAGFEIESENGLVAPAGTPADIVNRLSAEVGRVLRDPAISGQFLTGGFEIVGSTPAEYGERLRAEVALYAKVVKISGARAD